ncbi:MULTISPECIES: hypothetical protein [Kytococcus]|uniref:hypothetical protein n=1 Tax=Kytococcus TaxID=57499 RepID=UPI0008A2EC13|nr:MULTISPECIES: hypothetical protein [Kytococcus]OFS14179.1 hypothetical protein HMPREF3099_04560 [Kytococcus sp. HMSC28H12]
MTPTFEELAALVPDELLDRSGSVFYSGREAFEQPGGLYLLGLNPGGDPETLREATVRTDIQWALGASQPRWSRYRDEEWGAPAGTSPLQRRVLHLLDHLGLDAGRVPSSNLVFVRSRQESGIATDLPRLAEACWPFHQAVIDGLGTRTVVCFGSTVAARCRHMLGAHDEWGTFREDNRRGWTSRVHRSPSGVDVIQVTHPGRADWCNPACDPSPLVKRSLHR